MTFSHDAEAAVQLSGSMVDATHVDLSPYSLVYPAACSLSFGTATTTLGAGTGSGLGLYSGTYPDMSTNISSGASFTCWENADAVNLDSLTTTDGTYFYITDRYQWDGVSHTNDVWLEDYYVVLTRTSGIWSVTSTVPAGDGVTSSHVIRINAPIIESTVASTTFDIDIDYVIDDDDAYDANGIEVAIENLGGAGGIYYTRFSVVDLGWDTSKDDIPQNESLSITAPFAGTYKATVRLIHSDSFFNTPPYSFPPGSIQTVDSGKLSYFHVVSEDYDLNGTVSPTTGYAVYPDTSCDIDWVSGFDAGDCVGYLLTPSQDVWGAYAGLDEEIMGRFPFSYMTQLGAIRDSIYGNTDDDPPSISVTILGGELVLLSRDMVAAVPFATTVNTLLTAFIYLLLVYALYAMTLKMHDSHTNV